jgi:RING finger/CHY zinc finger protein 1
MDLRKKIIDIQKDTSLTIDEKNNLIQKLMYNNNENNNKTNKIFENCCHYTNKKCTNFYYSCCNNYFSCQRCHQEQIDISHIPILKSITCSECLLEQTPTYKCQNINCNILFSKNHCSICNIWTELPIQHCDKCKICRVGYDNIHCDNCDICFDKENYKFHKCIKKSYKDQKCCFCLEDLHYSQKSSISLKCEHLLHIECLEKAAKNEIYKCPLCRKSMYNIDWSFLRKSIKLQPLIEEEININDIVKCKILGNIYIKVVSIEKNIYNNGLIYKCLFNDYIYGTFNRESLNKIKEIEIYCNECEKKCISEFHYLGSECKYCHSFNTVI